MSRPRVCCPKCGGTGAVELAGPLGATYDAIPPDGATVLDLLRRFPRVSHPAMSNRLARLCAAGLVVRRRAEGTRKSRWFRARGAWS